MNCVSPFHMESLGSVLSNSRLATASAPASGTIGGANVVIYIPFLIYEEATAVKMSLVVGATNTGNVDVGIYDNAKNRLVNSGSVALGTASTLQEFDTTDTVLVAGKYYMAVTLANAAGTVFRLVQADEILLPCIPQYFETTGGFGLPATAAWAISTQANTYVPCLAVHFDTLI